MRIVGRSVPRFDGLDKASGRTRYADDFSLPGLYHGMTVRSPHAHARIESIRWNPTLAPPDAVCVLAPDIRGRNGVKLLDDSWPVLAHRVARHVGEPVALVAARTRLEAREAMAAVEVSYAPLDAVLTMEEAEGGETLHDVAIGGEEGDPVRAAECAAAIEEARARGDLVLEGTYRTGLQEHIYIECQGMTAWFDIDGTLNVHGTMQCPFYVLEAITHCLGIPGDRVRVKASAVGGGFGGKEDFPSLLAIHAALLTRACGQPVKIVYDRQEDIAGTTKRHPSRVRHRTAFARDGRILAMDVDVTLDGGAYRTLSPVVLSRAVLHATGPYRAGIARVHGRVVRTNTPPNGAFRGFGAPQTQFAVERHLDRAARDLGLDPFEIRRVNALCPGDALPTGQVLDATTSALECLEEVERRTGFREKWAARPPRSGGVGLSLFFHGSGFTGNGERKLHSPVTVRLAGDGRLEILTANTDMGQGCDAVFRMLAAEAAGVGIDDVALAEVDTTLVPDSGPTVASRTTMIVGALVAEAAAKVRDAVLVRWRAKRGGAMPEVEDGAVVANGARIGAFREIACAVRAEHGPLETTVHHDPPGWQKFDEAAYFGAAYPAYSWGACVAEVEVDEATLDVRPARMTSVCEVGRAIHPALCIGQIEGGLLQAVGHALWEEIRTKDGRVLNDRLATYIIPTFPDAPRFDVHLIERPWDGGPYGAKGAGELPMDGGAAAVVQAIENATGIVACEIPATPERLFAWRASRAAGEGAPDSEEAP